MIARSCRPDGVLLRADRTFATSDAALLDPAAFASWRHQYVWQTFSAPAASQGAVWVYVLALIIETAMPAPLGRLGATPGLAYLAWAPLPTADAGGAPPATTLIPAGGALSVPVSPPRPPPGDDSYTSGDCERLRRALRGAASELTRRSSLAYRRRPTPAPARPLSIPFLHRFNAADHRPSPTQTSSSRLCWHPAGPFWASSSNLCPPPRGASPPCSAPPAAASRPQCARRTARRSRCGWRRRRARRSARSAPPARARGRTATWRCCSRARERPATALFWREQNSGRASSHLFHCDHRGTQVHVHAQRGRREKTFAAHTQRWGPLWPARHGRGTSTGSS